MPGTTTYKTAGSPDVKYTNSGFMISAFPGICFFPSPKIGLESSFGSFYYQALKVKDKESGSKYSQSNGYGLNLNLDTFYLGFKYYF